jgi:hypothetical protein
MTRDDLLNDLAELLAGLQVPLSLNGPVMLGAGCEPYRRILDGLPGFGWRGAEDFLPELSRLLDGPAGEAKTFSRFKYAEEHAADLIADGHLVRLTNAFGVENEDHYLSDKFTVEDLGEADPANVGRTGEHVGGR